MDVRIEHDFATFRAEPEHGQPVTFEVRFREVTVSSATWPYRRNVSGKFVVGLIGSTGAGFAQFRSFEKACSSALSRARRYERAYAVPRGVQAVRDAA